MSTPDTRIFEYIRRRKSGKVAKVGVIVGMNVDGVIRIGWSKCNFKKGDKFNSAEGLKIAQDRVHEIGNVPHTPNCIRRQVRQFGARAVRYFQSAYTLELPA